MGRGGEVPASMAIVTDSNRPPTASATSSNRLSNRFWGRLWGPFPSDASVGGPFPRLKRFLVPPQRSGAAPDSDTPLTF